MPKTARALFFLVCFGALLLLVSCEDSSNSPASSSQPQQVTGVKGAINEKKVTEVRKPQAEGTQKAGNSVGEPLTGNEKAPDSTPYYDPKGRVDPFLPIIEEMPKVKRDDTSRVERRTPQTPLEKVDLSQLKLVGIIGSSLGPSAVVEESSGRGYVVTVGTYMGINSGRVTTIDMDRIVVTEIVVDWTGEIREERRELKLQKPTGE